MIIFHRTATIHAPLEKVFATVADLSRIPEWRMDVLVVSHISGETQMGTTFYEEVKFMGKNLVFAEVTEFASNHRLTLLARRGMALLPELRFIFTADGNHAIIDLEVTIQAHGFFRRIEFLIAPILKRKWARNFENLDALMSDGKSGDRGIS